MIFDKLGKLVTESGFVQIVTSPDGWKALVMIAIACVLLYLGIKKQYEPLLMVGIAVGCLLANVSVLGGFENALYHQELWDRFLNSGAYTTGYESYLHKFGPILSEGGLIVVVTAVERGSNYIVSGPEIISRGFVYVRESEDLMDHARESVVNALERCIDRDITDWSRIKTEVKEALSDYVWKKTKRSPMILPIIMEA